MLVWFSSAPPGDTTRQAANVYASCPFGGTPGPPAFAGVPDRLKLSNESIFQVVVSFSIFGGLVA